MKKVFKYLSAFIMAAVMLFAVSGCSFASTSGGTNNGNGTHILVERKDVTVKRSETSATREKLSLEDAVEQTQKSVVAIEIGGGAGAGVITDISIEGVTNENYIYIITCHHVISSKGDIVVKLADDSEDEDNYENPDYIFTGVIGGKVSANADKAVTLVGGDFASDVALIKIDLSKPASSGKLLGKDKVTKAILPPDGYKVKKGESVYAIGNPTGMLPGWLCTGVVSSLKSSVKVEKVGEMALMGITATTNPGNSGGALFNMYGELIGITNAGNTEYEAINFAIPISIASSSGNFDNGFLNVIQQLAGTATAANYGFVDGRKELFGFSVSKGADENGTEYVYVLSVNEGSTAESAGLEKGDIITKVAFTGTFNQMLTVSSYEEYTSKMSALNIGDTVKITVLRQYTKFVIGGRPVTEYKEVEINTLTVRQFLFCDTGEYGA
mgnify:CR=1 FL=1